MKNLCPFSLAAKKEHNLNDLSGGEFNRIVFAGATMSEPRSASDAFTLDEMNTILNSDAFKHWPNYDKDFLWNAYSVDSGLDDRG